jgi:hypothetical protein
MRESQGPRCSYTLCLYINAVFSTNDVNIATGCHVYVRKHNYPIYSRLMVHAVA